MAAEPAEGWIISSHTLSSNSSSVGKFRKHVWKVWLAGFSDLASQLFAASLAAAALPGLMTHFSVFFFSSSKCFLAKIRKQKCPPPSFCNVASEAVVCAVIRLMSCWRTGRWEDGTVLPYLVPPVGPGPLTLTFHVSAEAAHTGSDCSHSTEAEAAPRVPPSGRQEQLR